MNVYVKKEEVMKSKVVFLARTLLGLVFFVFGLNGFLHFIPVPPMPDAAMAFMGALLHTGYMFPMIKGVEVVGGLMLLTNCWAPLALILLAPNIVNILLFHTILAPSGAPMAIVLVVFEAFLAWSYCESYAPLFKRTCAKKD
jgi:putative oxidoreductase